MWARWPAVNHALSMGICGKYSPSNGNASPNAAYGPGGQRHNDCSGITTTLPGVIFAGSMLFRGRLRYGAHGSRAADAVYGCVKMLEDV